ncbi:hypothetical protein P9A16_31730 [Shinella sp. 838]|uniref:hypothetical protein n=1 Tax=Shinella sp. 838 TaxID=3038164 RepID=UPI002414D520|nr:hypothetical protein [Shinella sp. 838]MDG4675673.1 hypothetical protein [Shinella sp. 838]
MKTKNPATVARGRAPKVYAFRNSMDSRNPTEIAPESLAARKLSQRFGVPASTARLLAELAGLGPRDDREAVFPFTAVPQPFAGSHTYGA